MDVTYRISRVDLREKLGGDWRKGDWVVVQSGV